VGMRQAMATQNSRATFSRCRDISKVSNAFRVMGDE
jgi:hypothetical protein